MPALPTTIHSFPFSPLWYILSLCAALHCYQSHSIAFSACELLLVSKVTEPIQRRLPGEQLYFAITQVSCLTWILNSGYPVSIFCISLEYFGKNLWFRGLAAQDLLCYPSSNAEFNQLVGCLLCHSCLARLSMTTNRTEETELKIADCHLIVLHKIAAVSDMGFDFLLGRVTHLVFIYPLQEKCGHIERLSHFQGKSFSKDCLVTIHQVFELGSFSVSHSCFKICFSHQKCYHTVLTPGDILSPLLSKWGTL